MAHFPRSLGSLCVCSRVWGGTFGSVHGQSTKRLGYRAAFSLQPTMWPSLDAIVYPRTISEQCMVSGSLRRQPKLLLLLHMEMLWKHLSTVPGGDWMNELDDRMSLRHGWLLLGGASVERCQPSQVTQESRTHSLRVCFVSSLDSTIFHLVTVDLSDKRQAACCTIDDSLTWSHDFNRTACEGHFFWLYLGME